MFASGDTWTSEASKYIWSLEPQLILDKCLCIILKIQKQLASIFKEICFFTQNTGSIYNPDQYSET